jgi:4-amino-4-deoxy-L-arabinose transferase-like glycosyltransferase
MNRRRFGVALAVIAVVAAGVRVTYTVVVDPRIPELSDASTYYLLANALADGHGFIRPYEFEATGAHVSSAEFPPLFPLILAVVAWFGATSLLALRLATSFVGVGTTVVVGLLGNRVGGAAVGLGSAALAAVHPALFQGDGVAMSESLFALLVATSLLLTYRATEAPSLGRWAVVGAAMGLAALTRSEALVLLALGVVPVALRRGGPGPRPLAAVIAAAAALAVLGPWTVRNYVVFDSFVPLSNNFGGAVLGANCDQAYHGAKRGLWVFECVEAAERPGLDEDDAARRYRSRGIDYARDHGDEVPGVMAVRWLRTWGFYRPSQQIDYETFEGRPRAWARVGQGLHWVLLPIAAAGAVLLIRGRRLVWPLLATYVAVSVTVILTYGNQRFRVMADVATIVLASVALVHVAVRVRPRPDQHASIGSPGG